MKKILLPLVCCLMATSCLKENTFYMENYTDFATFYEGKLVTDNAYRFSVVDNQSGTEAWKKEGERFFIKCDILNRNLEIRLKSLLHVDIEEALPYTEEENEPDDPVEVMDPPSTCCMRATTRTPPAWTRRNWKSSPKC